LKKIPFVTRICVAEQILRLCLQFSGKLFEAEARPFLWTSVPRLSLEVK
jgi:hypothetical protein